MDFRIGYLDSGIGGINYLEALNSKLLVNKTGDIKSLQYKLYYLADTAAFPYGNQSEEYLVQRITQLVQDFIMKHALDMVVLACNTASLLCIDSLRMQFTEKIVGVVPAIKPAVELSVPKIYVMNTNAAGNSYYAKDMAEHSKEKYGNDSQVFLRACQDLVDAIELMVCSDQEAYHAYAVAELSKIIEEIVELDCQAVVLGCTHFLHIKRELQTLLPDTHIIDSVEGVSKRTLHLVQELKKEKLATSKTPAASATENTEKNFPHNPTHNKFDSYIEKYFLLTDTSKKERYVYVSKIYNMEYLGLL